MIDSKGTPSVRVLEPEDGQGLQARAAGGLLCSGVKAGDRVGLVIDQPAPEWAVLVAGALRVGIVPVLVNSTLLPDEQRAVLDDADVALTVASSAALHELLGAAPIELATWPLGRPMHYTSGTTGRPKGVWAGVLDDIDGRALWREELTTWQVTDADRHLVLAPLHHSAPLRFAVSTLLAGGALVVPERFDPGSVATVAAFGRATTTFVSPAHLRRLVDADALDALGDLRQVVHAGAPCPDELKRLVIDTLGADVVWELYGSTEGQYTACAGPDWLEHPGTVGLAREGRQLSCRAGVLWCRPPRHARWRYWRDDEATAAAWDGDEFTVGDLGRIDDGLVYIEGRRDDLIISGGVNVSPAEVERAIASLPGVADAVVFGRDDRDWGERVCAVVAGRIDPSIVDAALRPLLAPYKRPKEIHFVEAIDRDELGKARRRDIAASLGLLGVP